MPNVGCRFFTLRGTGTPEELNFIDAFGAFDVDNNGKIDILNHRALYCEYNTPVADINNDGDFEDSFTITYKARHNPYSSDDSNVNYELVEYPEGFNIEYILNHLDNQGEVISNEYVNEYEVITTYRKELPEYSVISYPCKKYYDGMEIDLNSSTPTDVNGDGIPEYLIYSAQDKTQFGVA
jgi:hypothetical protein